jgi:outer membrane protein assembly factor BamD (BamD/ComL family)
MKKTVLIYIGILVGIYVTLSALNVNSEYTAEKAIWKINRDFGTLAKDPEAIPDAEFQRVFKNYIQFKNKYKYSKLAPIAHVMAARVFMYKKDYVKARGVYEEIAKTYKTNPNIQAQAIFEIAESYNRENNFPNFIASLKRLVKEYPLTELGYQAPITLAEVYLKRGEQDLALQYLNEAVDHYNSLTIQYKNKPDVVFNSLRSVSVCYMAMKKWNKAVETLGDILMRFPETKYINTQRADKIITSINMISITKLKDYDLPITIYQNFITKYPKHPYRKALEAMVHSLNVLKEKNVAVTTK